MGDFPGSKESTAGAGSFNTGKFCTRDMSPLGAEGFITPSVSWLQPGVQCRWNKPGREYEPEMCDKLYHGGGWKRLCLCMEADWAPTQLITVTKGFCQPWKTGLQFNMA